MEITVEFNTIDIISQLIGNLKELETASESLLKKVDLKVKRYVTPMSILPLCVYAHSKQIAIDHSACKEEISSYLDFMGFPTGTSEMHDPRKTYLKISKVSCEGDSGIISEYEKGIIDKVPDFVNKANFQQSLNILTGELIDNVKQHAKISEYWIVAQYWATTRTCEIAIADAGIGYRQSYEDSSFPVETDHDAIQNAIKGLSSKSTEYNDRGYGIPTTIKLFCKGYGGEILIMSGKSLVHLKNQITIYDVACDWQGSFIGIKFRLANLNPYSVIGSMPE